MPRSVARLEGGTLGAPFRGSLEAPIKVVTGTASLAAPEPNSRERDAARLTPALYHLVPRFAGALLVDPGLGDDLYDVATWQKGVIDTIAEYIRLHGLRPGNQKQRRQAASELLGDVLGLARAHRDRIESFVLADAGLDASRWRCLVGVDAETRVRLRVNRDAGGNFGVFDLRGDDRVNGWGDDEIAKRSLTGDGTGPYLGARPTSATRSGPHPSRSSSGRSRGELRSFDGQYIYVGSSRGSSTRSSSRTRLSFGPRPRV